MPFTTLLVPLSVFFAVPGNKQISATDQQRQQINRWFWRASFSKRYSSGVLRNLSVDIEQMRILQAGKPSELGNFSVEISPGFFTDNTFGLNNVNTKTFILLLASLAPLSFISGAPVDLAKTLKKANRNEFHHLMPRAFLKDSKQNRWRDSVLANFAFLSRADNVALGGVPPSQYRAKMPADVDAILASAAVTNSLFKDDFVTFVSERSKKLAEIAAALCGTAVTSKGETS